jgi:predicted molibdopterin-dependent oxidoreductase YjgC
MRIEHHPILDNFSNRKEIHIVVDGKKIEAFEGETIASAMFASNMKVNRKTAIYHEPRGVFCNKGRCTDCIMKVDGLPNIRTCITSVRNGMVVESIDGLGKWEVKDE